MRKKADEIIKQPHFIKYKLEDRIRNHYTHPDATRSLIDYVESSYGVSPESVETADFIYLDPGGPVFSKERSPPIEFYIDGIGFSVKAEHMVDVVNMIQGRRPLMNDPSFSKVYMAYTIAVLPEGMFDKIVNELYKHAKDATELRSEMQSVFAPPMEFDSDIEASMIIKDLVKLANSLDKEGFHKEADRLDSILTKVAEQVRMNPQTGRLERVPGTMEQVQQAFDTAREKAWEQLGNLKRLGDKTPQELFGWTEPTSLQVGEGGATQRVNKADENRRNKRQQQRQQQRQQRRQPQQQQNQNEPYVMKENTPDGVVTVATYRGPDGQWPGRAGTPDGYVYTYTDGTSVEPKPKGGSLTQYDWYVYHPKAPPTN